MHSARTKRSLNIRRAWKMSDPTRPGTAAIRAAAMLPLLSALLLVASRPAHAQTETVLYNFCSVQVSGTCTDGSSPASSLTFRDGNYYGTTINGGAGYLDEGYGTVFQLSSNGSEGWNETVLYNFCSDGGASCTDGGYPDGPVVFDSMGSLYGTTFEGGSTSCPFTDGCGVVFELSPPGTGWTETVLHTFCLNFTGECSDGNLPGGILVMDAADNLYGQVAAGVFQLSPSGGGWTYRLISPGIDNSTSGLTLDAAGNIFGVALNGAGQRVAFELSSNGDGGWNSTVLYTFTSPSGSAYWSPLVLDHAGNLYGVSQAAGKGTGTVYELSPGTSGWTKKTLFTFNYDNSALDGFSLSSGLALDASGNIYGTTSQGGTYGFGTVFELVPVGLGNYEEKVIWSFNGTDGSQPTASPVLDSAGNLYGTTRQGGSTGNGVVFEVTPAPNAASTTTLAASKSSSTYYTSVTFNATVAPQSAGGATPTGTITFMDGAKVMGAKLIKNGTAALNTNSAGYVLSPGSHTITAVYRGDVTYSASTSVPLDEIITLPTTTLLTTSPDPSVYGQPVIFSATVLSSIGAPPDGDTVTFEQGPTVLGKGTLSGGVATFSSSMLGVGTKAVKAAYRGDTYLNASVSNPTQVMSQVVDKAASTTALVSSQNPSIYGQSVTFTPTVSPQFSGTPAGTVEFYNGTKELGTAAFVDGVASFTTTKLAVGTGSITAKYFGNGSFLTSTSSALSQVVN
jgi:uncharacterized repeat protein (TIGR03803 family)